MSLGALIGFLAVVLIVALLCYVAVWAIKRLQVPEPLSTVITVAIVILGVLVVLYYLWPMIPHPVG